MRVIAVGITFFFLLFALEGALSKALVVVRPGGKPPRITRLIHSAGTALRPGSTLRVTLYGEPGGAASFDIVGVTSGIAMRQVARGVYRGTYVIQRGTQVAGARVVGHLRIRRLESTRVADKTISIASASLPGPLSPGEPARMVREVTLSLTAQETLGWSPSIIHVKEGQTISFRITSQDKLHRLVIPDLNVQSPDVQKGETREFSFPASRAGTFPFHCAHHPQMTGTLIVEK